MRASQAASTLPTSRIRAPRIALWAFCIPTGILIAACAKEDRLTGGYDDVENPALTLSLQDPQGSAFSQGEIKVYARYQNPTLDTLPLLVRAPSASGQTVLHDSELVAAMRVARDRGISWPNPDSVEFNVVSKSGPGEAFAGDFILARDAVGSIFRFRQRKDATTILHADAKGNLPVSLPMGPPVLGLKGSVGTRGLELGLNSIFIAGSPYWTLVAADGSFTMARMAKGRYQVKAMSTDGKIYAAADTLLADSAAAPFSPSDWSEADLIWIER